MPRVSRNALDKVVGREIEVLLADRLASLDSHAKVSRFIRHFLTPEEETMLAKRLAAAMLISYGVHYRSISRLLKISYATINTIRGHIKRGEYQNAVLGGTRLVKNSRLAKIMEELLEEKPLGKSEE